VAAASDAPDDHDDAATGAAARAGLAAAVDALGGVAGRDDAGLALLRRFEARQRCAAQYVESYRRYCWTVATVADLRIAPSWSAGTARRGRR
jgi:protein phosphatase